MPSFGTIARRTFLIGSAAIVGGVAFGTWQYRKPLENPLSTDEGGVITPYVLINNDGVTIITPRAEMGQGIHTTLAALVAEELDLSWDQVRVMHGPPAKAYYNSVLLNDAVPFAPTDHSWIAENARNFMAIPAKFLGFQLTGGSTSTPDGFEKMRAAGAIARSALISAAARQWNMAEAELKTDQGFVVAPDGKRLSYLELASSAAKAPLPDAPQLKPRSEWKLLGRSLPRVDMVSKATGTAIFAGDIRLPGSVFATVKRNAALGGGLSGYDASAAEKMEGVIKIVPLPDGVAVVARSTWQAFEAANAIEFDWGPAPYAQTSQEMRDQIASAFVDDRLDATMRDDGDVAKIGEKSLDLEYDVPHLAHAPMEPQQATAVFSDGHLRIWAGSQAPGLAQQMAAKAIGIEPAAVEFETTVMGGGFGRRADYDISVQAALIAKAMEGTPVVVTWTREEDMAQGFYRPMAIGKIKASIANDRIASFDFSTASTSIIETISARLGLSLPGPDATLAQGAWEMPYAIPNYRVAAYRAQKSVPVSFWRSVGASYNSFFHDCAIDELAHLAGIDPFEFRLSHLDHDASKNVLKAVAEMAGWGHARPGRAQGIAFAFCFGVPSAQVIEVEETPDGIKITGAWAAVDVGIALDPRNIEAQVSGAMVYGLSAAVRGQITFTDGKADQQNFWDYEPLRMSQIPEIEVRVLESLPQITGIGEPGTAPAAPALANALFALTGKRARSLPLSQQFTFA